MHRSKDFGLDKDITWAMVLITGYGTIQGVMFMFLTRLYRIGGSLSEHMPRRL